MTGPGPIRFDSGIPPIESPAPSADPLAGIDPEVLESLDPADLELLLDNLDVEASEVEGEFEGVEAEDARIDVRSRRVDARQAEETRNDGFEQTRSFDKQSDEGAVAKPAREEAQQDDPRLLQQGNANKRDPAKPQQNQNAIAPVERAGAKQGQSGDLPQKAPQPHPNDAQAQALGSKNAAAAAAASGGGRTTGAYKGSGTHKGSPLNTPIRKGEQSQYAARQSSVDGLFGDADGPVDLTLPFTPSGQKSV